jgi:aminoglycoside phosphotransferase family enzyme/predicted kinase
LEASLTDGAGQRRLILALQRALSSSGNEVALIETHISYVLLTGPFAYKIKKAVAFAFLDFTTLALRRFYCGEELRLNRRLAPDIYLGVAAITGRVDAPEIDGRGPVLEYAVKMRQFDQEGLLSRAIARAGLTAGDIDALAAEVASFHHQTDVATGDAPFGRSEDIRQQALANFDPMAAVIQEARDRSDLEALLEWTKRNHVDLDRQFAARRQNGFVRECHGDLHLGNIALVNGRMTLFDRIEFNDSMRWTDVMSDVAFLVMDLRDRGRPDLGARFLTGYLDVTGDYDGLKVLRFYVVYRALVRAKIACLRLAQENADKDRAQSLAEYHTYANLAQCEIGAHSVSLAITHGPAGSGKTTRSQTWLEATGAVRVRSDVERKRMHGLHASDRGGSGVDEGLYGAAATDRTYARLAELARTIVTAGYAAIVDATFLKKRHRDLLRQVALDLGVQFAILDCSAPAAVLRERDAKRIGTGSDASDATVAVLERQIATEEPLTPEERRMAVPDATPPQS